VFIELLRNGEVDEAVRAFKKVYLELVDQIIHYLHAQDSEQGSEPVKRR
jgi:hypothetical protein